MPRVTHSHQKLYPPQQPQPMTVLSVRHLLWGTRALVRSSPMYLELTHGALLSSSCSLKTLAQSRSAEMCETYPRQARFFFTYLKSKNPEQSLVWKPWSKIYTEIQNHLILKRKCSLYSMRHKVKSPMRSSDVKHMSIDIRQFSFSFFYF